MRNSIYLAWRYMLYHRGKTLILVLSFAVLLFLPAALEVLVRQSGRRLRARAVATPLVVGAKGSPLELVLNTLYFATKAPQTITMRQATRIRSSGYAEAIPVFVRFQAKQHPIVATTLDYFDYRGLRLREGRQMTMLGHCVLGCRVADELQLRPGDTLLSTPENVFQLAGEYPLKMHIVGVLQPSDSADDEAVFVDLKTAWIIAGLGHGHEDLSRPEAAELLLDRDDRNVTASAAVMQFTEITSENIADFHFHGEPDDFPLTAVIAVPPDERAATLLRGQYLSGNESVQMVRPEEVVEELLATVVKVRTLIIAGAVVVGASTLATMGLVFLLALRMRQGERRTMAHIGSSRFKFASIVACEVLIVLALSAGVAAVLTRLTTRFGTDLLRWFVS